MTKSPVARLRNERGVTTAEYAVVTAAGCEPRGKDLPYDCSVEGR